MKNEQRVFSFSDRVCPKQPTGGPGGVNFRLFLANQNYGFIENMYHIFGNGILEKDGTLNSSFCNGEENMAKRLQTYYKELHGQFQFTADDVYIFHDVYSAAIFIGLFAPYKTVLVYHQQGSLYKEMVYFNGSENLNLKKELDQLFASTVSLLQCLAFPSIGAAESLMESEPATVDLIKKSTIRILYNGCDCPEKVEVQTKEMKDVIQIINETPLPSFVTVATLNAAKGVERIPEFLAKIKEKYGDFRWVVVGGGIKDKELMKNVLKYGIGEQLIWIENRVPHDDILALYQCTDFYILAHRFSIFDYATIEAMSYGNIPILTPVGGNKEMIIEKNGIFLNDLSSTADFDEFMENQDVEEARKRNESIASEKFSEASFLKGYADLVEEMKGI